MCQRVRQNRILAGVCNVNIFCSNEANEFSVFCSKPPYLVGHSFFFIFFFFLMAHLMLPEKKRGSATAKTKALSFADFCDPLGVKWMLKFLSACYQFTF